MAEEAVIQDSSAPEAAQFSEMSEGDLGKLLDEQESGAPQEKAAPQTAASSQAPKTQTSPQGTPSFEERLATYEKRFEAMQRELGQSRATQARMAKLEQLLQQRNQAQAQAQASPQNQNLTAEQRQAQERLDQYVQQLFQQRYGALLDFGQQQMAAAQEQAELQRYASALDGMAKDFGLDLRKDLQPILSKIVDDLVKAKKGGDAEAEAKLTRILGPGGEGYLFALGAREHAAKVAAEASSFQQQQRDRASSAGQTLRPGNGPSKADEKKALTDFEGMSREQQLGVFDKMGEKELGDMLNAAGVR